MNTYKLTLTLQGPLGTPLSADTLWGHLCWGIVYHQGPAALEEFLAATRSPPADGPPLVLSDPLPAGFMPRPILPPPEPAEEDELVDSLVARGLLPKDLPEQTDKLASLRRRRYVSLEDFRAIIDNLSVTELMRTGCEHAGAHRPSVPRMVTAAVAHNTIDRLTNHTLAEGGLFFSPETFTNGLVDFDVWTASSLDAARVRELFTWGLEGGYGRDASTGKGNLAVGDLTPASLPAAKAPNAMMTLGPCAPAADDPTRGHWTVETRFGKLGGPWATQDDPAGAGVFKHPVIFLAAGAVLAGPVRPFLGRLVEGVHPGRPEVVQYGLALTVPVRCPHFQETR